MGGVRKFIYLLDSNVFIDAFKFHYRFDFHPGFWDWLIHANKLERVFSIDKVYDELSQQKDDLFHWIHDHKDEFILKQPLDLQEKIESIRLFLNSENFNSDDIDVFSEAADSYLIAYAMSYHFKIVTHEVIRPLKGRIKIPTICKKFDIECISPFKMLQKESPRFILDLGK